MGKKILSLILVALLCVSLFAGCGNTEKSDDAQKMSKRKLQQKIRIIARPMTGSCRTYTTHWNSSS